MFKDIKTEEKSRKSWGIGVVPAKDTQMLKSVIEIPEKIGQSFPKTKVTYLSATLWRSLYRTWEHVRSHVLMDHPLQVPTSCDTENVGGGRHKMEKSGPQ